MASCHSCVRCTPGPSLFWWVDEFGQRRQIPQQEGGEQGDPLILFCLAVHNALGEVQAELLPGERLFAYLDDVYVLCLPERCRKIYNLLADKLQTRAGIRLHTGKTRTWNRVGERPPDMEDMGPRGVENRRFEGVADASGHMAIP